MTAGTTVFGRENARNKVDADGLKPGQTGLCRVRHNVDGQLLTSSYGHPVLMGVEPIEKKQLFHVLPGSRTLSLGTAGCNLECSFCVNWRVSQSRASESGPEISPAEVVEKALAHAVECIAFTYTEPTILFEYARAIAQLAREAGLAVVAKSNGYMSPEVLRDMAGWLDAINIDLKGWIEAAHHALTGAYVQPVLENLRLARRLGIWTEVSTLLTPGLSETSDEMRSLAEFIAQELGPETPWHWLRLFPAYQMADQRPTAQDALQRACDLGSGAGLSYVYPHGLPSGNRNTRCPVCRATVIVRPPHGGTCDQTVTGGCRQCGWRIEGFGLSGAGLGAARKFQTEPQL
jgi:pyruvate formate lyase activating enzyme